MNQLWVWLYFKFCVASVVAVRNTTGDTIHATVRDGDGTVIIDEDVASGSTSASATFNNAGTGEVCASNAVRTTVCRDIDVTANCFFIPTLSEWGVGAMVLLLMTAGTVVFGRRHRVVAA